MIFTSYWFLIFAASTTLIYWLLPRLEWRLGILGIACLTFHAHFAGPAGMAPIFVLMAVTYACGRSGSRACAIGGIVLCILTLCFYKYTLFLIGTTLNPFSQALAEKLSASANTALPAAAPLGISFFVFEFVHYLYEVMHGGTPITNPLKFLLFSIFYPSLVAGPIKRYNQFLPSLEEGGRKWDSTNFTLGIQRIGIGFFKKVIIADNLTVLIENDQASFDKLGLLSRWIFVAELAFRILADFSGYSDIAIGCARLLGVRLPENFNWPYLSRNLREFWDRWHISLSTWLRDYVYIPLGGGRSGTARRLLNVLIAFALCGLWHGPAWHFVVWGIYQGLGLAICTSYRRMPVLGDVVNRIFVKEPLSALLITQVYVAIGWVVFFYPIDQASHMIRLLFML